MDLQERQEEALDSKDKSKSLKKKMKSKTMI